MRLNQAFLTSLLCCGICCSEVAAGQSGREASTSEADNWRRSSGKPSVLLSFSYPHGADIAPAEPFQLHVGSYFEMAPQLVASADTTCSVTPPLPEGLHLNRSSCVIQGVPGKRTAGVEALTVTASNSHTSLSTEISLAVVAGKIHTVVGSREAGNTQQIALPGLQQKLNTAWSLCFHRGKLYIGQWGSIAEMDLRTGKVQLLLGNPGTPGNEGDGKQKEYAKVGRIAGMVVYKEELYFADWTHHMVRKVGLPGSRAPGLVSRVAGTGTAGFSGDGGRATAAKLNYPQGLAIINGELLIADHANHCIRAVYLEAGGAGIIATVAGTPTSWGYAGDGGPALQAKLCNPIALLVVGKVAYVAEWTNHRIRSIDFQQSLPKISTFAGGGEKSTDGTPASELKLTWPQGLGLSMDDKMYVTCRDKSHTVVAIDLQYHHPTSLVAGTGVEGSGRDFIAATSSPLDWPIAVVAPEEGSIYIAERYRIRQVAVSGAVEHAGSGAASASGQPAELMDKVPFLGTWSTLTSDGDVASPFCLPAASAYMSPALPQTSNSFRFSLSLEGPNLPPCVLGVARRSSIAALAENFNPGGSLTAAHFKGAGIMLAPLAEDEPRYAVVPYAAGMIPVQALQATSEVVKLFLRDTITITGSVSRKEVADGSCQYTLQDVVLLNRMQAALPSFSSMTTPSVGADVAMHIFIAAWDASSNQLQIIVKSPPLLERSSS